MKVLSLSLCLVMLSVVLGERNDSLRTYFNIIDKNRDNKITISELADYLIEFVDVKDEKAKKMAYINARDVLNQKDMNWQQFSKRFEILREPSSDIEPQQIHLSTTGNPTEMIVMWATKSNFSLIQSLRKDFKLKN
jgi:hypothetical protein